MTADEAREAEAFAAGEVKRIQKTSTYQLGLAVERLTELGYAFCLYKPDQAPPGSVTCEHFYRHDVGRDLIVAAAALCPEVNDADAK